jgi:hypothetical protein
MLKNLMSSKPSFSTNLFGGGSDVYQSKYKWLNINLALVRLLHKYNS